MAKIAKRVVSERSVVFHFANGKVLEIGLDVLAPAMVTRLAVHGLSQKIGDAFASAETVQEAYDAACDMQIRLCNGEWASRVETVAPLALALSRATGKTYGEAASVLDSMDAKSRKALGKHPGILAALADIAREKAASAPDLGGLFAAPPG